MRIRLAPMKKKGVLGTKSLSKKINKTPKKTNKKKKVVNKVVKPVEKIPKLVKRTSYNSDDDDVPILELKKPATIETESGK